VDAGVTIDYIAGTLTITPASTSLRLVASPSGSVPAGWGVAYSATVSKGSVPGVLTGTVTFTDDGTPICSDVQLVHGTALCLASYAIIGQYSVEATYENDPDFSNSHASLTQIVVKPPFFRFQVVGAPA
jgi:hypothetical protein